MDDIRYNLLTEPLLSVRMPDGTRADSCLPVVLAQLCAGEDLELAALQAHQQHAVYAFLVQLAAILFHHGKLPAPQPANAPTEDTLRSLLRSLGGDRDEPFCLFVSELGQPAFMQPPVPEGKLDAYKNERARPDELDVLATAKNLDVKKSRISRPRPEHWVYALVSLQTTQGFTGRANYGISRMNGGFGSRPYIALSPTQRMGARFLRDVRLWLARRSELLEAYGYDDNGPALLWMTAWNGVDQVSFRTCDPFYIEICRRVRLTLEGNSLRGFQGLSETERLGAKEAQGKTGDLWTPVKHAAGKAFTASDSGLRYDVVQELLLSGDYESPACVLNNEEAAMPADWTFIGRVLVRGNKTEGLHERVFPVPVKVRKRLARKEERDQLRARAQTQMQRTSDVQRKVLYPALMTLFAAGEDARGPARDRRLGRFTDFYTSMVDAEFFKELWDSLDLPLVDAQIRWDKCLRSFALAALEEAIRSTPLPAARREKAIARAEIALHRGARSLMTDLYAQGAS